MRDRASRLALMAAWMSVIEKISFWGLAVERRNTVCLPRSPHLAVSLFSICKQSIADWYRWLTQL